MSSTPPLKLYERVGLRVASYRPVTWLLSHTITRADRWMLRRTRGRQSLSSLLSNMPIVELTSIGARSGKQRKTPLLAIPHNDGYLLVASNFGQDKNPSWAYNLRANPHARINRGGREREFHVREAHGEERDNLYQRATQLYIGYVAYERRTRRTIPVFVLEPPA